MKSATPSLVSTRKFALALAATLLAGGFAPFARADFTGPYADTPVPADYYNQTTGQLDGQFGNWSLSGNDYHYFAFLIDATSSAVTFNTNHAEDDGNGDLIQLSFQTTAAASGMLSFSYQLSLGNTFDDTAVYAINGVQTSLTAGSNTVSGVMLNAGDMIAFEVTSGPQELAKNIVSDVSLTVTDFIAPVPEPSCGGWLGAGGGLAGIIGWRRALRSRPRPWKFGGWRPRPSPPPSRRSAGR